MNEDRGRVAASNQAHGDRISTPYGHQGTDEIGHQSFTCVLLADGFIIATVIGDDQSLRRMFKSAGMMASKKTFLDIFRLNRRCMLRLGEPAVRIATVPNAGGKSVVSEALSMEYMTRRFGCKAVITEMEIDYWSPHWKKVDYITNILGTSVGVSVTRAMGFPSPTDFQYEDALRLLRKKLYGLVVARAGVTARQRFDKSVLHIWCETWSIAMTMRWAWGDMGDEDDTIRDNVVVILTVAEGVGEIFHDDRRLLGLNNAAFQA